MEVKLSRGGVCNDLSITPFKKKIVYSSNNWLMYNFSSQLNLNRFLDRLEENRNKLNLSLSNRFGFEIENNVLCDIKLYSSIEKRGFLLKNHKEGFECLASIRLDGKRATIKS